MSSHQDKRLRKLPWPHGGSRWHLDGKPVSRLERRAYDRSLRKARAKTRKGA